MKTNLRFLRAIHALSALLAACSPHVLYAETTPAPVIVVTDGSWEVSAWQTSFTPYTLSADQMPDKDAPLHGGSRRPVTAKLFPGSRVIPGTQPIWTSYKALDDWEAYQFRRTIDLGKHPVKRATLVINCDDAARVYINKRPVDMYKKSADLRTKNGRMQRYDHLTACLWSEVNTYDVTSFFYTNVTNTVFVEMANQPFHDNHAYLSAKIIIEFEPLPENSKPPVALQAQPPVAKPAAPLSETRQPATQPSPSETQAENRPETPTDARVFDGENPVAGGKLRVGTVLELGDVYFKPDDYALDDASYRTLSALASFLKKNKKLTIEVGGHTNLKADDSFAMRLSTLRAKAVAEVLIAQGVDADRVTYKGYGKTQPKMPGTTTAANQKNQRVEVKITGI